LRVAIWGNLLFSSIKSLSLSLSLSLESLIKRQMSKKKENPRVTSFKALALTLGSRAKSRARCEIKGGTHASRDIRKSASARWIRRVLSLPRAFLVERLIAIPSLPFPLAWRGGGHFLPRSFPLAFLRFGIAAGNGQRRASFPWRSRVKSIYLAIDLSRIPSRLSPARWKASSRSELWARITRNADSMERIRDRRHARDLARDFEKGNE